MRKPRRPTLLGTLPPPLLHAWQSELTGTGVDARAHWWAMPHWVPRRNLTAAPRHKLLADTVRHIAGELDACFGGVEMWVQRRAASAAMHLHWDMDEERVRCAQKASPPAQHPPHHPPMPPYSLPLPTVSRLRRQLRTPVVSIVVYLGDAGGPTLVLAQVPHALLMRCTCACIYHRGCLRRCRARRATGRGARGASGRTLGRHAAATRRVGEAATCSYVWRLHPRGRCAASPATSCTAC